MNNFVFDSKYNVSEEVKNEFEEAVRLRRQIHQNPELAFYEYQTQKLVIECLSEWKIDSKPLGKTGVSALIEGEKQGKVLLLRGDMDALPIQEENDCQWRSSVPGVMHACGHDAHTAIILTVAKIIKKRGIKSGAVKFMFQPAEEGGGGARQMISEGILENPKVDAAVGFHVWSEYDIGTAAALSGAVTASVDGFKIIIKGKGTHGAIPDSGVDPINVAAQIITSAQALITRKIRATEPAVLSFTGINSGSSFNIIPESAEILGTFRTFNSKIRSQLKEDLILLCKNIGEVFGADTSYSTTTENAPMISDESIAKIVQSAAASVVGESGLLFPKPKMVGEDFGEILESVPGAFVMLGCKNNAIGANFPHHHPRFAIDEQVLGVGVEIALRIVDEFCGLS